MSGMNWTKAASRDLIRARGADRVEPEDHAPKSRKRRPLGISNEQAKELAALQRRLGVPYTGNGMTAARARSTITSCQRALRAAGETP